jgi:hypothetical protein
MCVCACATGPIGLLNCTWSLRWTPAQLPVMPRSPGCMLRIIQVDCTCFKSTAVSSSIHHAVAAGRKFGAVFESLATVSTSLALTLPCVVCACAAAAAAVQVWAYLSYFDDVLGKVRQQQCRKLLVGSDGHRLLLASIRLQWVPCHVRHAVSSASTASIVQHALEAVQLAREHV